MVEMRENTYNRHDLKSSFLPLCTPAYHLKVYFGLGSKFSVEGFALAEYYCGGTVPSVTGRVHLSNPAFIQQAHLALTLSYLLQPRLYQEKGQCFVLCLLYNSIVSELGKGRWCYLFSPSKFQLRNCLSSYTLNVTTKLQGSLF